MKPQLASEKKIYDFTKSLRHFSSLVEQEESKIDFAGIYPIHVRIEPTELCNLRCNFCIWHDEIRKEGIKDTVNMKNRFMDPDRLINLIKEFKTCGVQAVSFTGAGDPLAYPYMERVLDELHKQEICVGVTSNFSMPISTDLVELLAKCVWVRWSQNAGDSQSFRVIHNPKNNNSTFERAKTNLQALINEVKTKELPCEINSSVVVNKLSRGALENCIKTSDQLGIKTIQFRPDVPLNTDEDAISYEPDIIKEFDNIDFRNYKIVVDTNLERDESRQPDESVKNPSLACFYSGFTTYVAANFDVYPCCYTRIDKKYVLGNLKNQTFKNFWETPERISKFFDIKVANCPKCPHVSENEHLEKLSVEPPTRKFRKINRISGDKFF